MHRISRRVFVSRAVGAAAAPIALSSIRSFATAAQSPNEQIRVAVAGIRGQGWGHVGRFQQQQGVKVVALCDPDSEILANRLAEFKSQYSAGDNDVTASTDIRKVLDRDDVDVLVTAAPNHWHALMTVWACQAGKHVYVEKPVSHSIWEGRQMVQAARKYNRLVQAGTQQRSCPAVQEAARDLQQGKYGKVLWVHCSRLNARASIGKVADPQPVPPNIDYNLWAGPAPMTPVMRQSFHYDWHWQWNWGDGEMANWGVHYLDDLHHLLGWKDVPNKVVAAGNRWAWDDNGQTPNIHLALFHYDQLPVVVDIRNLPDPARRGGKEGAVYLGRRDGNYIQCEHASVRISRTGGGAYDADGKRIHQYKGDGGASHVANFIAALRTGKSQDLAADIEAAHQSTAICHMANIAWRVGRQTEPEQVRQTFQDCDDAAEALKDILQQLDGNQVDLAAKPFVLGPTLTYDRTSERFVGNGARRANRYLRCPHRPPFVIPDSV